VLNVPLRWGAADGRDGRAHGSYTHDTSRGRRRRAGHPFFTTREVGHATIRPHLEEEPTVQIFGELERLFSEVLYPYRVPLTAGMALFIAAAGGWAWRAGWVTRLLATARRRPGPFALVAFATLAILVPLANYLVAPLWTRSVVMEVSPLDAAYPGEQALQSPAVVGTPVASSAPPSSPAPSSFEARVVRRGEWKGADEFHFARGRLLVIEVTPGQYVLRVEDFSVRNGPDLFVMLSPAADGYRDGAVKLGRLKGTDGAFNYEIPAGTKLEAFSSAVIWCEQFSVLFGTAPLTRA